MFDLVLLSFSCIYNLIILTVLLSILDERFQLKIEHLFFLFLPMFFHTQNEEDMSVEDRIAFALNYLPDAKVCGCAHTLFRQV